MKTTPLPARCILLACLISLTPGLVRAQLAPQVTRHRAARHRPQHPVTAPSPTPAQFGSPLPGLTVSQLADFLAGKEEFESVDTPESGLGPIFNNTSCAICHSDPVTGGSSSTLLVTRFGRTKRGVYDPLADEGGSLLQLHAIVPECQEVVPANANIVSQRRTTPLFGFGLIEAIPDSEILQNAHRRQPDGISGRAGIIQDIVSGQTRVGHFGWKAQQATLLAFSGDAYLNEIGITSRLFPEENAPNGDTNLLNTYDLVDDPEDKTDPVTGKADIDHFTDFMQLLGPPPPLPLTQAGRMGQMTFSQIGCANCHTPTMTTGANAIRALDHKTVALYSDLLLHDMGSLNDGIAQADALPNEMKTPPLWGLREKPPYLHDGRADTVDEAIRAHDGEASRARQRYLQLSPAQRQQLLSFLNSL